MAVEPVQVLIASGTVSRSAPLAARCAKSSQRSAILDCEMRLLQARPDATPLSKTTQRSRSHCRGLVAVGQVADPDWRIGIDIEYADPRRNWAEIVRVYAPDLRIAADPLRCAALWAFGEAWFKAAGELPGEELLHRAAARLSAETQHIEMRFPLGEGNDLYAAGKQIAKAPGFWLFAVLLAPETAPARPRYECLDIP